MKKKYFYLYEGPVLSFGRVLDNKWKSSTVASTEKEAIRNLTYQFKIYSGLDPKRSKVKLEGALTVEGSIDYQHTDVNVDNNER